MTNEQKTALKLLLRRHADLSYEATIASESALSRYNDALVEESIAEQEVLDYVDTMLTNAFKDGAGSVLDKSFWSA